MKLNRFTVTVDGWEDIALLVLVFRSCLFKLVCDAIPLKAKRGILKDYPGKLKVLLEMDLDLVGFEVFVPPDFWERIKDSLVHVEGPHLEGPPPSGAAPPKGPRA